MNIQPGQVWADNGKRYQGRKVRVVAVENNDVISEVVTEVGGGRVRVPRTMRFPVSKFAAEGGIYTKVSDV